MADFISFQVVVMSNFFCVKILFFVIKISVERLKVLSFLTCKFIYPVLTFAILLIFFILCWGSIPSKPVRSRRSKFAGDTVLTGVVEFCNAARSEDFLW